MPQSPPGQRQGGEGAGTHKNTVNRDKSNFSGVTHEIADYPDRGKWGGKGPFRTNKKVHLQS